ncbi:MAG: ferric reductase-like transmembrane domain-containing protein [Mycobacteriales bacterium]
MRACDSAAIRHPQVGHFARASNGPLRPLMSTAAATPRPTRTSRAPRLASVRLRPTPRWWRDAVGAACWATALIVVALWLRGRGMQGLAGSAGDRLTSIGRVTGLVAADLLLIQVFLMARVPIIERSYGQDELARRHRLVGFCSFNFLLAHIALITVGYALTAHVGVLTETWTLVSSYGGMILAVAATAALTAVVVTSVRMARKRLRYESWHLLHLYAYLGVGLSIPHEIWTGQDFSSSGLARLYWWSSYAAAAGVVLVFRVGMPLARTLRHGLTVTSVIRESPDVVTVRMGGRGLHRLPARAGQFFIFRFLDGPGWSRGNPYSLSAAPRHDRLQITAKDLGDGSNRLAAVRPGTKVLLEGPYGRLTGEERVGSKVAMIASGIGITPMRALLEDLTYQPGDAVLIYRAHSEPDLVFRMDLDALAAGRGITIHYLTGARGRGADAWLPQNRPELRGGMALRQLLPGLAEHDVFVCGPDAWMDSVTAAVLAAGLPAPQLHVERFTW